jgi:hypothetical protein
MEAIRRWQKESIVSDTHYYSIHLFFYRFFFAVRERNVHKFFFCAAFALYQNCFILKPAFERLISLLLILSLKNENSHAL